MNWRKSNSLDSRHWNQFTVRKASCGGDNTGSVSHKTPIMIPPLLLAFFPVALAAPAPAPVAVAAPHPMITPRASLTDRRPSRVQDRDIVSSIEGLGSYLSSVIGTYPSYIASGVPNFFQDFPTGSAAESSLSISPSDLAASPTKALNIP